MKKTDFDTEYSKLKRGLLLDLRAVAKIELHEFSEVEISENKIELGVRDTDKENIGFGKMLFASEVAVRCSREKQGVSFNISFGSSGSFDPSNTASTWRTIHAASILKNWLKVCEVVKRYTDLYKELEKKYF